MMEKHSLNDSLELQGHWFLPEKPDRKIAGHLLYSNGRIELHLYDSFVNASERGTYSFEDEIITYPVIHGLSKDGKAITLLESKQNEFSLHFGPMHYAESESLVSNWLFIGDHIDPQALFHDISFRIPGMQIWFSTPTIIDRNQKNETTGESILSFVIPGHNMPTTFVQYLDATLDWGISREYSTDRFSKLSVDVSPWLTISSGSNQSVDWFISKLSSITTMLSFLAGTPMLADCIEGHLEDSTNAISIIGRLKNTKICAYSNTYEFFVPYELIKEDFEKIIFRWCEFYPKIEIPSQLAIDILASEELWLNIEFISLMQALEGFHRCMFDGTYMEKKAYDKAKQFILDAIPNQLSQSHKDSLQSRIKYGNEISLQKRLEELSEQFIQPIREFIFGGNGKVPRIWVDTRNYYTHWDESLANNILDMQSMFNTNSRLKILLCALYINLMGVPQEILLTALKNSSIVSRKLKSINCQPTMKQTLFKVQP